MIFLCIRDKDQKEVDFAVIQDGEVLFLVEAKTSARKNAMKVLEEYRQQTGCRHAFQVVKNLDYVEADCFEKEGSYTQQISKNKSLSAAFPQ